MNKILTEKQYQRYIIDKLTDKSVGYIERTDADFDRYFAIDKELLFKFLDDIQKGGLSYANLLCNGIESFVVSSYLYFGKVSRVNIVGGIAE